MSISSIESFVESYNKVRESISAELTRLYSAAKSLNIPIADLCPEGMVADCHSRKKIQILEEHQNHPDRICTPKERKLGEALLLGEESFVRRRPGAPLGKNGLALRREMELEAGLSMKEYMRRAIVRLDLDGETVDKKLMYAASAALFRSPSFKFRGTGINAVYLGTT